MSNLALHLPEVVMALSCESNRPIEQDAHEMIVLGLYWRRAVPRGKAAPLLRMERFDFVQYAPGLGDMTQDE